MSTDQKFAVFDSVRLRGHLNTRTIYGGDIHLRPGQRGCIIELGTVPGNYIVEFRVGQGMRDSDFTEVEVVIQNLLLEHSFEGAA